jgi:aminopeptidase N
MGPVARRRAALGAVVLGGCGAGGGPGGGRGAAGLPGGAPLPVGQDIVAADIVLDLDAETGTARMEVAVAPRGGSAVLAIDGLTLLHARVAGGDAAWDEGGRLVLQAAPDEDRVEADLAWRFPRRGLATADGWMADAGGGATLTWPHHCANLFPCDPSPAEGARFSLRATAAEGQVLAPGDLGADAPSYQPAVARGDYARIDLGTSPGGVAMEAWHLPGRSAAARAGTASLPAAMAHLEALLGPYPYGGRFGAVEVDWGPWSWGGMEHHPLVHVAAFDFGNPEVQVHELVHAWFGGHVRIACWEDLVLSEGTTTYLTARALAAADGTDLWPMYVDDFLGPLCSGDPPPPVTLPDATCGAVDLTQHPLGGGAPYFKGACFFEELGDAWGPDAVDAGLASFVGAHGGGAARMQDLLDHLAAVAVDAGARDALDAAATDWLRTPGCPAEARRRCRSGRR